HFGSFIGSRSFIGDVTEAEIDGLKDRNTGLTLRESLAQAGFGGRPRRVIEPDRYVGYLEAHIEQGAELEDKGLKIGVVTAIVGSHRFTISFQGVQNHAGTTRMAIRKDAGVALVRLAAAIEDRFPSVVGPRTVWTTGRITLDPGQPSIVPGGAEMLFQFRDTDPAMLDKLDGELAALIEAANQGPCTVTVTGRSQSTPRAMDESFQAALDRAAETRAPGLHQRMPSGAGHDAQVLAEKLPSSMLFVPSIGGISHHYSENTADEDLVLGCQVCADAAAEILSR
ncbi:MAG: M20/M25/M40 family metallo-hydrolase, partial [Acetobacteraceae bacterium]